MSKYLGEEGLQELATSITGKLSDLEEQKVLNKNFVDVFNYIFEGLDFSYDANTETLVWTKPAYTPPNDEEEVSNT